MPKLTYHTLHYQLFFPYLRVCSRIQKTPYLILFNYETTDLLLFYLTKTLALSNFNHLSIYNTFGYPFHGTI